MTSNLLRRLRRLVGLAPLDLTLIGNPFAASGRSEHFRSTFRALVAAGVTPRVYRLGGKENEIDDPLIRERLVKRLKPGGIHFYHSNGSEARRTIERIEKRQPGAFAGSYNIVNPHWELPRYPQHWADELNRFDEVWVGTRFLYDALRPVITARLQHLPDACAPRIGAPLDRAYFGLSPQDFIVLFFFDYYSYQARKNPLAVVEAFRQAVLARPEARLRLVMKVSHSKPTSGTAIAEAVQALGDRAVLIDRTMADNEIKNLISVADCFLSLHRSEGFGRGPAEAMFLGRPAIATGWSGNMDYMTPETSFPVGYDLIPVKPDEYIETEGQVWADPDVSEAAAVLVRLVDDRTLGPRIGAQAARHMAQYYSDAVLGGRYRDRLRQITRGK